MLRVAVTRAVSRSNAVRAFATQASASTKSDFDALAAVIDSDEGRRQLASIRAQFLDAHVRLAELESQAGPKIDWEELKKTVDPSLVQAHEEAVKGITWPKFDTTATVAEVKAKFEAFKKDAEALSKQAEQAVAEIDKEVAKTERIKEKVASMTIDEYLKEFPEEAPAIDSQSLKDSLMP